MQHRWILCIVVLMSGCGLYPFAHWYTPRAHCRVQVPMEPYQAAVYAPVAEYVLRDGPIVGCFLDYYPDQTFAEVAVAMESSLRGAETPVEALDRAQEWVDEFELKSGQPRFDLVSTFQLEVSGDEVHGGFGPLE